MNIYVVSYDVYGSIYHYRTSTKTKAQAVKECCNAMGCKKADIVDVWKER